MTYCNTPSFRGLSWEVTSEVTTKVAGVPQVVTDIASRRGITDFKEFFKPSFAGSMPDPNTMVCMEEAVARVAEAINNGEKIFVYGDYDVDGATSTSLMMRYLLSCSKP